MNDILICLINNQIKVLDKQQYYNFYFIRQQIFSISFRENIILCSTFHT